MPSVDKVRLFISHAWTYNHQYYNLVKLLEERPYFDFYNYSVPQHAPLNARTVRELENKLRNQMRSCQVVIVLAGVYATYRDWMKKEIEIAMEYEKPIVGVRPRGQNRISQVVQDSANRIVGWNADSVVSAIREVLH
jgi:hypothetical protein